MLSVIVLTPNGRRQTVKVSPNTTMLQVLEEACKKHGFCPEEYDITHYNKVMDLSVPIRFSGLPNNAQLEMVPVKKPRLEAQVTVALQFEETLERVTENFMPSDSLLNVVTKLCPLETRGIDKVPVIVYMRREIVGNQALSSTSLKDLGLTGGRAVLRFALRNSEQTPELKATGSGLYIRPPPSSSPEPVQSKSGSKNITEQSDPEPMLISNNDEKDIAIASGMNLTNEGEQDVEMCSADEQKVTAAVEENIEMQCRPSIDYLQSDKRVTANIEQSSGHTSVSSEAKLSKSSEEIEIRNIEYIGERNALIFSLAGEGSTNDVQLPDDFFNITVDDVRYLMRDLKRIREDLEDQPLCTGAMKELKTSTQTLSVLHDYKNTVIRIQFPDRLVLQGIFSPVDTIETVREFVKKFLEQPDVPFYLYITPPKRVLEPEVRLVEANCVPRALLYFGINEPDPSQQSYLKNSLLSMTTSHKQASVAALQVRKTDRSESKDETRISPTLKSNKKSEPQPNYNRNHRNNNVNDEPSTSGIQRAPNGQTMNKMPKWFRP